MRNLLKRIGVARSEQSESEAVSDKTKVSFNMHNLNMLSAFASSSELKERLKKYYGMLKEKVRENWGLVVGSQEYEEMWKMTNWVSSDPEMAERIRRAVDITTQITRMSVQVELTKKEIQELIKNTDGKYFPNEELPILKKALESF